MGLLKHFCCKSPSRSTKVQRLKRCTGRDTTNTLAPPTATHDEVRRGEIQLKTQNYGNGVQSLIIAKEPNDGTREQLGGDLAPGSYAKQAQPKEHWPHRIDSSSASVDFLNISTHGFPRRRTKELEATNGEGSTNLTFAADQGEQAQESSVRVQSVLHSQENEQDVSQFVGDTTNPALPHTSNAVHLAIPEKPLRGYLESRIRQLTLQLHEDLSRAKHVHKYISPNLQSIEDLPCDCFHVRRARTLKEWLLDPHQYMFNRIAVIYQLFQMVRQLHSADVVVGNLNPSIVAFCSNDHLWKLISLRGAACIQAGLVPDCCEDHAAPELIESKEDKRMLRVGKPADMWSLGVITMELMTGKKQHGIKANMDHIHRYIRGEISDLEDAIGHESLVNLLQGLLQKDPRERYSIREVFQSDFFKRNFCYGYNLQKDLYTFPPMLIGAMMTPTVQISLNLKRYCLEANSDECANRRETWPAPSIVDDSDPQRPVFIQRKEEKTVLEIRLDSNVELDFECLEDVKVSVAGNEEESVELRVETKQRGKKLLEAIAELDPAKFKSRVLSKRSKSFGNMEAEYTKLGLDFTVVNTAGLGNFRLGAFLYVKVLGRRAFLFLDRLQYWYRMTTDTLPQWTRSIGRALLCCLGYIPIC